MNDYILHAIESVERKAALGRARLTTEREAEQALVASGEGATSTISAVDAALDEMERIIRLAGSARRDYAATHGDASGGTSAEEDAA